MNAVTLGGGLGNQLFQYAYGRALQERGHAVCFDRRDLDKSNRTYLLDAFNTRVSFLEGNGLPTVCEKGLRYDPWWLDEVMPHARLCGYWQCERYFEPIANKLRSELTLRDPIDNGTAKVAAAIAASGNSVGLHVRRSDGLHPSSAHHGVLPLAGYYREAMALLAKEFGPFDLFVFSDDPAWCRGEFRDAVIVDVNPMSGVCDGVTVSKGPRGREYEDLWLMSLCHSNIIANSTFSWWGAWLNPVKRRVIAPRQWFIARHDGTDIVPARWVKL